MKVAFQGEPGAYSEEAGYGYFGEEVEMMPQETFCDVFEAVASGACLSGLIPIENSLAGSIHQNYDLLLQHDLHIVGEYFLSVCHCLIGFPGVALSPSHHPSPVSSPYHQSIPAPLSLLPALFPHQKLEDRYGRSYLHSAWIRRQCIHRDS